ncbi:MAG TPA: secretin N-terminal domain-containing protein [Candidatus Omnitrophota bacterium]|nr:secretin N-terminal domain-containing protein [Candidatus Omnitrophota bacterium]
MKVKIIVTAFFMVTMFSLSSLGHAAKQDLSSLRFKDTDIGTVLKAIEKKAAQEGQKVNIVATPEVYGLVTVDLEAVDWKTALKVILKMYDLGYTQDGPVITVSALSKIQEDQKKEDDALFASGGMKIEAFKLKHVEAADAAKMIQPFLTKEGKISVMDVVNKQGWGFSATTSGMINVQSNSSGTYNQPVATQNTNKMTRTKILAIADTPAVVRQVAKLIAEMDVAPKQVLIRAIMLEVNRGKAFDLGLDFGTINTTPTPGSIVNKDFKLGAASRYSEVTKPSAFQTDNIDLDPYKSGLKLDFMKVNGTKFDAVLHALQADADTNTLSTPTVLTMDGREATILVGQQFPIIETSSSTYTDNTVGGSLSFYQNIGIQLRVVPQICGDNEDQVNLIVHPTVSDYTKTVDINGPPVAAGDTPPIIAQYPIINTREAETQMVVEDGETVVLGGLLKDAKKDLTTGVPGLSNIPIFGKLFDRKTDSKQKTDLLIFLTVKIVRPGGVLPNDVIGRDIVDQKVKAL